MIVDQTYVNNLRTNVNNELKAASLFYSINSNNGIDRPNISKDIQRLFSIYTILENYNVTHTYFSEDFILKINREYKNHCGTSGSYTAKNASSTSSSQIKAVSSAIPERAYEYTSSSTVSIDNGVTNITLPETPLLKVNVFIQGWNMSVGNGIKTKDVYFSADSGVTAKQLNNLTKDDVLYYNAVIIGTNLLSGDNVRLEII